MRLLLDTQIMLWWLLDDPRLSPASRELIGSRDCLVSVASIWEVSIKHRLGKLPVARFCFAIRAFRLVRRSCRCWTAM